MTIIVILVTIILVIDPHLEENCLQDLKLKGCRSRSPPFLFRPPTLMSKISEEGKAFLLIVIFKKSLFLVFKIIIIIMIGLTEKGAAKTIVSKSIRNLQTSLLLLIVKR